MIFKKTNNNILGIDEYYYEGVRFLYKKGISSKVCCFFSSFVKEGSSQKYHYVREFLNNKETIIWFLDTEIGRGSYALDKDFKFLHKIKFIVDTIKNEESRIFLLGSSKGATIALFVYSFFSNEEIYLCVHAPQFFLEDFLNTTKSYDVKNNIEFLFQKDYDNVFSVLFKNKKFKSCNKLYISCGVDDGYHLRKSMPFLFDFLLKKDIFPIFIPVAGSHSDIAVQEYIKIIHALLNDTLEYDIYVFTTKQLPNCIVKLKNSILIENTIFYKSDLTNIFLNYFKNNTKIISYQKNNYLIEAPYFVDTLYAIYYRDKEGTKKIHEYTKNRTYLITIEGDIREITFFLKLNSEILTIKFNKTDIDNIKIAIH